MLGKSKEPSRYFYTALLIQGGRNRFNEVNIEFEFPNSQPPKSIRTHKADLSICSEYMRTQLATAWAGLDLVVITDFTYAVFAQYLSYLYSHNIAQNVDIETLESLAQLADKYNEAGLRRLCTRRLVALLNSANFHRLYKLANDLRLEELKKKAEDMLNANLEQLDVVDD